MAWIAILVGAFYVFAGYVSLRAVAWENTVDRALVALGEHPEEVEQRKAKLLTIGGCVTLSSGLALATTSLWAPVLFAAGVIVHVGFIVWATGAMPPQDETEAQGRRATIRAAAIYAVAGAFAAWCAWSGVLQPWLAPDDGVSLMVELGVIATATAIAAVSILR